MNQLEAEQRATGFIPPIRPKIALSAINALMILKSRRLFNPRRIQAFSTSVLKRAALTADADFIIPSLAAVSATVGHEHNPPLTSCHPERGCPLLSDNRPKLIIFQKT